MPKEGDKEREIGSGRARVLEATIQADFILSEMGKPWRV